MNLHTEVSTHARVQCVEPGPEGTRTTRVVIQSNHGWTTLVFTAKEASRLYRELGDAIGAKAPEGAAGRLCVPAARIAEAKETLQAEPVRAALASKPHPLAWAREKGMTLLEWVEWTMANAGTSGKTDAAIVIERAAK